MPSNKKFKIKQTATTISCNTKSGLKNQIKSHQRDVRSMMKWFSEQIEQRGLIHDWTKDKFFNTMWEGFEEHRKIKDGAKWKKWCKLHIKKERHHFTEDDTYLEQQTDLVDLIEWVCDTCCAGMARNGTYTYRKISSKTLQLIVKNTVDKILKEVEIIKKDR